jgi:D-glycero-alpha-D-manno-heptose-7-phosphate kinase
MSRHDIAELACKIEMFDLGQSSGKQDQYISAFGGISKFTIDRGGKVQAFPLELSRSAIRELESSLFLYYSGVTRKSDVILSEQAKVLNCDKGDPVSAMHTIQKIGAESEKALSAGELDSFGDLLHQHWLAKKMISRHMTDEALDKTYEFARSIGASGGKLMGAGGGGYWMFHVPPEKQRQFRSKIGASGLLELPWRFDFHGCSVIYTN